MTKGSIILATGLIALSIGAPNVSAKVKHLKLKVKPAYTTSKSISGTATKKTTVKISRYKVNYGSAKVRSNGTFKIKLKHKLRTGWSCRVTDTLKKHHYLESYSIYIQPVKPKNKTITQPKNTNTNSITDNNGYDDGAWAPLTDDVPGSGDPEEQPEPNLEVDYDQSLKLSDNGLPKYDGYSLYDANGYYDNDATVAKVKSDYDSLKAADQQMATQLASIKERRDSLKQIIDKYNFTQKINHGRGAKINQDYKFPDMAATNAEYQTVNQTCNRLYHQYANNRQEMFGKQHILEELNVSGFNTPTY